MEFQIRLLLPDHEKAIKEMLDYGQLRGFGQWRNSGKGRFIYEILEETDEKNVRDQKSLGTV